jgi:hypothetical protein
MPFVPVILLLLAANPQAGSHADSHAKPHPPAVEKQPAVKQPAATGEAAGSVIFSCDFGSASDRNYDGWPDNWTRRHGAGFHDFLKIGIVEDAADMARGKILQMSMNGGSAEVGSPPIPITPSFSYELEGECRLTDLVHDDVKITLTFVTAKGKPTASQSITLSSLSGGSQWQGFRLAPPPPDSHTTAAIFALQVAPRGLRQDLKGQAAFRRIRLQRLPRMTVRTARPLNIFTSKEQVEVQCEIAGIPHAQTTLHFELLDHEGRTLQTHSEPLTTVQDVARASWTPKLPDFGFYVVQVCWQGEEQETLKRRATIAVVHPAELPRAGQFGWTLPGGDEPLESGTMAALLAQAGVHWAKYPVAISPTDPAVADRIAWFAEKLSLQGVEMVGVLDHPPARAEVPIANSLEDETVWKPWVDPIMTRLSLKVRWWQLGSDEDTSLVGYPRLAEKTREVKTHLERFGQQVKLGTAWQWINPPPPADVPFAMQSWTSDPPLTATELEAYLMPRPASAPGNLPQRWVTLEPLSKSSYSVAARAHDLAARMLAAKVAGADAVFLNRPFDSEAGIMEEDGTPGDLFIPWRTTAGALTGAEYLGQLQLPGGSTNQLFARGGQAVMVVWNDKPAEETMYFGENLRQIDLWGHESTPPATPVAGRLQHRISVTTVPTFVSGLNENIIRFKLAAQFESLKLDSVFNREQKIYLRLKNFFPQAISGEVMRVAPAGWKPDTQGTRFRLAPGEEIRLPIAIQLFSEASSGPQPLRLDFNLTADRTYQFSVQRMLQLGLADVAIEMTSRLRDDGLLEVTQTLSNFTDKPVGFQCVLFPPGRRRETRQVIAAPQGQTPLLFLLDDGESLLGQKLTLRAEELGGGRLLNYSLTAER